MAYYMVYLVYRIEHIQCIIYNNNIHMLCLCPRIIQDNPTTYNNVILTKQSVSYCLEVWTKPHCKYKYILLIYYNVYYISQNICVQIIWSGRNAWMF